MNQRSRLANAISAARNVFFISMAMVMGPTPPGTGVMAPATSAALSYSTSPPFTVVDGKTTTTALPDTCFRQVEYAGVLAGAANEAGAQAFVDFLLSGEAQAPIPVAMYMYPIDESVDLPADWAAFAPLSDAPVQVDPALIAAGRDQWVRDIAEKIG